MFQGPALSTVFLCTNFVKNLLNRSILGPLGFYSSFLLKKLRFRVFFFLLNSIEDKDSRFIYSEQFHLMTPVPFLVRIQI